MATRTTALEVFRLGCNIGKQSINNIKSFARIRGKNGVPYRGTRGGINLQRPILPRITHRPSGPKHVGCGIDVNNLVQVSQSGTPASSSISVRITERIKDVNLSASETLSNAPRLDNLVVGSENEKHCNDVLNFTLLNARSVKNKASEIAELITDSDYDICAITETWLTSGEKDNIVRDDLTPSGYALIDVPRTKTRGGGVGIVYKSSLKVKKQKVTGLMSFEATEVLISSSKDIIRLAVIYRPPTGSKTGQPTTTFLEEFNNYIDQHATTTGQLLVVGDFNFHYGNSTNAESAKLEELLHSLNLEQHVKEATHDHGHILDLVITRCDELAVSNLQLHPSGISDHCPISFSLPIGRPAAVQQMQTYRKLKDIDIEALQADILQSSLYTSPADSVNDLVLQYNSVLEDIMDSHAPKKTRKITVRPNTPWYTDDIRKAKQNRRKAERRWRASKLTVHHEIFKAAQCNVTNLCATAKSNYYCNKIEENSTNQKELFKISNTLLNRNKSQPLPTHNDAKELADNFANFFSDKISQIRDSFPQLQTSPHLDDRMDTPAFSELQPTCESEVKKLILGSNSKSCSLDPIPTTILKQCIDALLPILVKIINLSFASSTFPDTLKLALVIPLIKKILLDWENQKNYRPVSNLPYLGKLIEKAAVGRFSNHTKANSIVEALQSAYKEFHSVETALLLVFDDLLTAVDNKKHVLVTLLDYSAAFDTIDHNILFQRLQNSYGVTGEALKWVESYFSNRHQAVLIEGVISEQKDLPFGMPQGSIFGPFSYPKYSHPIAHIAEKHRVECHQYADDTQLYVVCDLNNARECQEQMEKCIEEIRAWSTCNKLKLNDGKTEFLVVSSKYARTTPGVTNICVGNDTVTAVSTARNIGAQMDNHLTMVDHVNGVCKSAYVHLRNIAHIRRYLTQDVTATLIHSLVTSRLDNLNSLLYGLPDTVITKLQRIQNHAAKVIVRKKKSDHVTPILQSLHWLPVPYRIEFKVLLITHKCLNGKAPQYLTSRLHRYKPGRTLRSGDQYLLSAPRANMRTYGDRAFSVMAPKLWNSLPLDLRKCDCLESFKTQLKTYLFRKAFILM